MNPPPCRYSGDERHCLHYVIYCSHHEDHDIEDCCYCGIRVEINIRGEIVEVIREPRG